MGERRRRKEKPPSSLISGTKNEMVSRGEAARILGISLSYLKILDSEKVYPFEVDDKGWHWYNKHVLQAASTLEKTAKKLPKQVSKPGKNTPKVIRAHSSKDIIQVKQSDLIEVHQLRSLTGDVAARVFAELMKEVTPADIVVQCKLHPEVVKAGVRAWHDLKGGMTISQACLEKISALPMRGGLKLDSEENLLAALTASLGGTPCAKCKSRPARVCTACIQQQSVVSSQYSARPEKPEKPEHSTQHTAHSQNSAAQTTQPAHRNQDTVHSPTQNGACAPLPATDPSPDLEAET